MLAWLERLKVSVPPELVELVEEMGHRIADWRTKCEQAEADLEGARSEIVRLHAQLREWEQGLAEMARRHEAELTEKDEELAHAQDVCEALERELEQRANDSGTDCEPKPRGVDTRRHNTALRIIYGVARDKFHYGSDGAKGRSAVANIVSSLERAGIEITDKTVRSFLKDATDLIEGKGK